MSGCTYLLAVVDRTLKVCQAWIISVQSGRARARVLWHAWIQRKADALLNGWAYLAGADTVKIFCNDAGGSGPGRSETCKNLEHLRQTVPQSQQDGRHSYSHSRKFPEPDAIPSKRMPVRQPTQRDAPRLRSRPPVSSRNKAPKWGLVSKAPNRVPWTRHLHVGCEALLVFKSACACAKAGSPAK